jgi:EmrB/QacA subfamily drug resistance transporter
MRRPDPHPNAVLGALLVAALAFALAQTMVVAALPEIARGYDTSVATATWVLTGFLLSASVATPLLGRLGDLFGKGRVLTAVLLTFAAGSVVAGLASSIEVLIAGRVIQGAAGAVFPLSFGIIRDTFPTERVPVGIGVISAVFGIGGGIGLPLAGVIVDNADVSWLFWIGLVSLPAALGIWMLVPASPARERVRIDWAGAATLSVGLVALLLGISRANDWGWGSGPVLALLAGGVAVLAGWVALEARIGEPLVDMRVLRRRPVAATNITGFLVGFAMFGSFLLVPQFAQTSPQAGYGFGLSVTGAGLMMLPSAGAMLLAGPLAGTLGNRFGSRAVLTAGTIFAGASFAVLVEAHSAEWNFLVAMALLGVGLAFSFASMANLVVQSVDAGDVGVATGINTIARTIGGAFGAAVIATILASNTLAGTPLPAEGAYETAFVISLGGATLALLASLWVPSRSAPEPRHHGEHAAVGALSRG